MSGEDKGVVTLNETVREINTTMRRIAVYNDLLRRSQVMSSLGQSFGGERDLYTALGWPKEILTAQYQGLYKRLGMAKRVNDAPCDAIWCDPPRLYDEGEKKDTPFEGDWLRLVDELGVWDKLNRVDKLLGFGRYAILLLGFNDIAKREDFALEASTKAKELLYIQAYAEDKCVIKAIEADPTSARFGLPTLYTLTITQPVSTSQAEKDMTFDVHWTRVIHVVEGCLENEVYGSPRLEVAYNRLIDIQKIIGGSGEMFWLGARPGYQAMMDPEARWEENDPKVADMRDQLKEFEHKLRRMLLLQGVEVKALETEVSDPEKHLDAQVQDLAAGTRIPKRLLTGSERGELASSMDRDTWLDAIDERRQWFAEPRILRPFVDRLVEYGIVTPPHEGAYYVDWPALRVPSEKERAEVGKIKTETLKTYMETNGADLLITPEVFVRHFLGVEEDEAREILDWMDVGALEEEKARQEELDQQRADALDLAAVASTPPLPQPDPELVEG